MTDRLLEHRREQSLTHTFASVAESTGLTEASVRRVFNEHVETLDRVCKEVREGLTDRQRRQLMSMRDAGASPC